VKTQASRSGDVITCSTDDEEGPAVERPILLHKPLHDSGLIDQIDQAGYGCHSPLMSATVDSFFDEYARRYSERDVDGVTNLCLWPFLAIRRGKAIHMRDRDAVRDHFASAIAAYRFAAGAGKWTPVEIDHRHLGEHSVFATVHWNALDADGQVVRDTWTSYQLLATPDGWRFLSYTNHF
jgi:hypothetical protein